MSLVTAVLLSRLLAPKDFAILVVCPSLTVVLLLISQMGINAWLFSREQTLEYLERTLHWKICRPRGWYDSIDHFGRFKFKRIHVKLKASLIVEKNHHVRSAVITNDEKVMTLTENQSTYIPLGEVHRLANSCTISLEIIAVQSESYLAEDGIVRFEDKYKRSKIL